MIYRLRWHLSHVDTDLAAYSLKYREHTDFKVRLVSQEPCVLNHLFCFRHEPVGLTPAGPG